MMNKTIYLITLIFFTQPSTAALSDIADMIDIIIEKTNNINDFSNSNYIRDESINSIIYSNTACITKTQNDRKKFIKVAIKTKKKINSSTQKKDFYKLFLSAQNKFQDRYKACNNRSINALNKLDNK